MLKQISLSKPVWNQIYINSCKQYGSWSAGFSWKQCRSRSAGFWRRQLIRIHTVFNARNCELVIINQNMKYRIVLTLYIVLVQGRVNRNFRLVLNEMGPGRTSRAWYFHSPATEGLLSFRNSTWFFNYRNPTTKVFSLEELSKFAMIILKFFIFGVFSAIILSWLQL